MTRYPFQTIANDVLDSKSVVWADITTLKIKDRMNLMRREFEALVEKGSVSTMNPKKMTVKDVKAYLEFLHQKTNKKTGKPISAGEIKRSIRVLKYVVGFPYQINGTTWAHNRAAEYCLELFPHFIPRVYDDRLPPLTDEQADIIIEKSLTVDVDDYMMLRGYLLAAGSLCVGDRNKEFRFANKDDFDLENMEFTIRHPKGEGSYGKVRTVPFEPGCIPVLKAYLEYGLPAWHAQNPGHEDNPALFPSSYKGATYLTDKSLLKGMKVIEKEVGFVVNFQLTRRTYMDSGRRRGVSDSALMVMAGHRNMGTMPKHYTGISPEEAKAEVLRARNEAKKKEKQDFPKGHWDNGQIGEMVRMPGFEPES